MKVPKTEAEDKREDVFVVGTLSKLLKVTRIAFEEALERIDLILETETTGLPLS